MRGTPSLGLPGQPRGCAYSASLGSMANLGLRAQMGWSERFLSGGWLKAFEATIHASKFCFWKRYAMNSLASSWFLENFQMPMLRLGHAEWIPAGPPGLLGG